MTDPVMPPAEEVAATVLGVQHLGPHYFWNGETTEIVGIDHWVGDVAWYYHLGGESLCRAENGTRILGPVPMPPAGDPGAPGDRLGPTEVLADIVRRAYDSGVSAGRTGIPTNLQQAVKSRMLDDVSSSLGAMFAAGEPPLNTRSIDPLTIVSAAVDESVALGVLRADGKGGYADWGMTRDLSDITSRTFARLEPLLTRPNPHHPVERLRTYGQDDYVSWNGENAALRRTLLWMAGRAEVTSETRRLLHERISSGADRIVVDTQEEEHLQVLDFRKIVDELCTLVEAAVECDVREKSHGGSDTPGRLPPYWNGKAASRAEMLRSALEDLPEIHTLAGLRFA